MVAIVRLVLERKVELGVVSYGKIWILWKLEGGWWKK
jgi:hypothetical protein